MEQKNQLISIVLPVRNAARFLPACLESLLNQSYQNFEIIVVDDFSRDATTKVLTKYKRMAGRKLKIYQNVKRYGPQITLNRALKQARGKFVTFMNPQDICTRDRLKRQLNFLLNNPKTVAVGTQCYYIDPDQRKLGKSQFPADHEEITKALISGETMHFETVLINRYLLPKDLLYFPTNAKNFVYHHLFVKIAQYGTLANLNQAFYYHMRTSHSMLGLLKKNFISYATLWAKARFVYDLRTPFQSLLTPLVK